MTSKTDARAVLIASKDHADYKVFKDAEQATPEYEAFIASIVKGRPYTEDEQAAHAVAQSAREGTHAYAALMLATEVYLESEAYKTYQEALNK